MNTTLLAEFHNLIYQLVTKAGYEHIFTPAENPKLATPDFVRIFFVNTDFDEERHDVFVVQSDSISAGDGDDLYLDYFGDVLKAIGMEEFAEEIFETMKPDKFFDYFADYTLLDHLPELLSPRDWTLEEPFIRKLELPMELIDAAIADHLSKLHDSVQEFSYNIESPHSAIKEYILVFEKRGHPFIIEEHMGTVRLRKLADSRTELSMSAAQKVAPETQMRPSISERVIMNLLRNLTDDGLLEDLEPTTRTPKTSILFLAADPTDASRLRLGEELREIQEKLQLGKLRERFELDQRMSVRPADISQALLDIQPQIVHFSGHGMAGGELCFENELGETHPVQPDALAALFEQFASQIHCVVLNACYSEKQARAIASHIDYVIGMNQAIDDKVAIAFAIGFYQALGAGRTIEDAFKLGCVQIRLQGIIPEHLTPTLIKKGQMTRTLGIRTFKGNKNMSDGPRLREGNSLYSGTYYLVSFSTGDRGKLLKVTAESRGQIFWIEIWRGIYDGRDVNAWVKIREHIIGSNKQSNPTVIWRIEPGDYTIYFVTYNENGQVANYDVSYAIEID